MPKSPILISSLLPAQPSHSKGRELLAKQWSKRQLSTNTIQLQAETMNLRRFRTIKVILAACIGCLILKYVCWVASDHLAKRNAIVFYATKDMYACSILVNIHILKHVVQSRTRIIVIASKDIHPDIIDAFKRRSITLVYETPAKLHHISNPYYRGCLMKLAAFRLHESDAALKRALVLDADPLIVQNLDSIFQTKFENFVATPAYWLDNNTLSSTCMMIEPKAKQW